MTKINLNSLDKKIDDAKAKLNANDQINQADEAIKLFLEIKISEEKKAMSENEVMEHIAINAILDEVIEWENTLAFTADEIERILNEQDNYQSALVDHTYAKPTTCISTSKIEDITNSTIGL